MSTTKRLILDTTAKICADLATPAQIDAVAEGQWPTALWQALDAAGLASASAKGALADMDLALSEAYASVSVLGKFASPVPLAESLIATQLISAADIEVPRPPLGIAFASVDDGVRFDGDKLLGTLRNVAFGRHIKALLLVLESSGRKLHLLITDLDKLPVDIRPAFNAAGEPCDHLSFTSAVAARLISDDAADAAEQLFAMTRILLMAGAMESVLAMSVGYALERQQFGRPIAKFQAIQQQLAVAAGEVAVSVRAAEAVLAAVGSPLFATEVALGKARVGEAAGLVSEIGHQVHGAIGCTYEHSLHYRTRRLWVWRDEAGHEAYWQRKLGRAIAARGADAVWDFVIAPTPLE